ncbi:hypothetical protein COOONC_17309 [Cooperia oncophora]
MPREVSEDDKPNTPKTTPSPAQNRLETKESASQDGKTVADEKPEKLSAVEELRLLKEELEKVAEESDSGGGSKGSSGESFDEEAR